MRISLSLGPTIRNSSRLVRFSFLFASLVSLSQAITFNSIPSPNLDLSQLGRVGLAGDFNGISLYEFEGQNENGLNSNGSQSILGRFPNGGFATLASSDASIMSMCSFVMMDGTMAGVIVGGNFTSLGGMESQGVAMFNPNTSTVTPLTGISGKVSAVLCDQSTNTVYVGGSFKGANSTNAIAWVGTAGWTNLPFAGFNGPVKSITKAANGHIMFAGSFTGLGNASAPSSPDQQIINISGANVTSGSSTSLSGFSDPRNIICKTSGIDGVNNTWLLADSTPGFWRADFGFGFQPTKLRIWNTHKDGRGTQTWRFTALPINGIMNFTYVDPASGQNSTCTSECPLSNDPTVAFQDFHFVNVIGMDSFRIDISAWYGSGGGLNGIELFEDDIFAYAVGDFNEPTCANVKIASNATATGPWTVAPSGQSVSQYLTTTITATTISPDSASVIFLPDIKQSGNYSVNIYTPGCLQDSTCTSRGRVNITGVMASGTTFQTEIFQSNNFDKYDQIYFGYIAAGTSSFRPSVTLAPSSGQDSNLTVVAQRVGFTLISSTGGLNSLFEWDPALAVVNTSDFTQSAFDQAGMSLGSGARVNALATSTSATFVGGNFSTPSFSNIFSVNNTGSSALAGSGLNGEVMALLMNGSTLYVGGKFTNTSRPSVAGLSHVAAYDISTNSWSALGAGVRGNVWSIVPISMNITGTTPEMVITLTGGFNQTIAFGSSPAIPVSGFAVWVPSQRNWLQNINATTMSLTGNLATTVSLPGGGSLLAGYLSSSQFATNGAVQLGTGLSTFPVRIQTPLLQSSSGLTKRATTSQNVSGVVTGLFYESGGRNVTVLGGHFTATGTNGASINNLVFIDGANSNAVSGVGSALSNDSTVLALALQGDLLFTGGSLTGSVAGVSINGLISYDLSRSTLNTQPPTLSGINVAVQAIAVRPDTTDVYVGGQFDNAGALSCPGICVFNTVAAQWTRPGTGGAGTAYAMTWATASSLVVGGSLLVNGVNSSLAIYNAQTQVWAVFNGASAIPGPVSSLTAANSDASQLWVSGTATNGSSFLMYYDGANWNSAGTGLGAGTVIRGLQILSLTSNHAATSLIPASQTLMLTGNINVPGFGNASAVLFNGTTFQPFALTSSSSNQPGSISRIFSQQQNYFATQGSFNLPSCF